MATAGVAQQLQNVEQGRNGNPYSPVSFAFFCRFTASLFTLFLLMCLSVFVLWIALRSRIPDFTVRSLLVTSFNITPSSQVSGHWNLTLTLSNPNRKVKIYYDAIESSLWYGRTQLSVTDLTPFNQTTQNLTNIYPYFSVRSAYVRDPIADDLIANNGTLKFNLHVFARTLFRNGAWITQSRLLRVLCSNLAVDFRADTGVFASPFSDCTVRI